MSPKLYERYVKVIQSYLKLKAREDIYNSDGDLGEVLVEKWENHQLMLRWMRSMFAYLDRYHVKFNCLPTLKQRGLEIFQTEIVEPLKVKLSTFYVLSIFK